MKQSNEIKEQIQRQAHDIWTTAGRCGTLALGTGAGKSRIAIMEVAQMWYGSGGSLSEDSILLVSPTEKLRDENWPAEFEAWDALPIYNACVKSICFASLKNEKNQHYKLVILDECHTLTSLAARAFADGSDDGTDDLTEFFADNLADAVMGLTATEPDSRRDPEKARIIEQIAPVVFRYTLDQGVTDGMIADFEIRVIRHELDSVNKTIPAGTKTKPFKTTEAAQYEYMEKQIMRYRMLAREDSKLEQMIMYKTFARNRFIYDLPSKTALAAKCLTGICKPGKRTIVFCGSIAQCDQLLAPNVFHSKTTDAAFNRFNMKEIDVLGTVRAANMGLNFVDLDQALIIQVDSNARSLVQRIGRLLRVRPDHKAMIYILVVMNTADERWLETSLADFDQKRIRYFSSKGI